jgi:hypothetical protein
MELHQIRASAKETKETMTRMERQLTGGKIVFASYSLNR